MPAAARSVGRPGADRGRDHRRRAGRRADRCPRRREDGAASTPDARGGCASRPGAAANGEREAGRCLLQDERRSTSTPIASATPAPAGAAAYSGTRRCGRGETSIRADELRLDQEKGDLIATRRRALDAACWAARRRSARGDEIRYEDDEARIVTYSVAPLPPASARGSGAAGAGARRRWRQAVPPA